MLIEQPDPAGEGVDLQPRLERLLHGTGTGTSRSRPPLPRYAEARVMPRRVTDRHVFAARTGLVHSVLGIITAARNVATRRVAGGRRWRWTAVAHALT
jgi:hypothetical protein